MQNNSINLQHVVCNRFKAEFFPALPQTKAGISRNVKDKVFPINGLRIAPEGDTSGWYIWAGNNLSKDSDFFVPLHIEHLESWCPEVIQFLGLPPGWRFLLAPNYEDVWFDENLLGKNSDLLQ